MLAKNTFQRRDAALDIGNSVNELTSGEVSQDETSIAQSMELPSLPMASNHPGMPPNEFTSRNATCRNTTENEFTSRMPPAGMPPQPNQYPRFLKFNNKPVNSPLPPTGLPA